jgi:hypothetical protein
MLTQRLLCRLAKVAMAWNIPVNFGAFQRRNDRTACRAPGVPAAWVRQPRRPALAAQFERIAANSPELTSRARCAGLLNLSSAVTLAPHPE